MPLAIWDSWIAEHECGTVSEEAVEERDFFREATVRGRLGILENEGPARVSDRVDAERERAGEFEDLGDGQEELGGPACLEDDLERVDEEARLGEDIRVELGVGELGHDGATSGFKDRVELRPSQGPETPALWIGEYGWVREGDFEALFEALETNWRNSH